MTEQETSALAKIADKVADTSHEIVRLIDAGNLPVNYRLTHGNLMNALAMLQAAKSAIEG